MHGFSGFWIHGFSVRASRSGLLLEDVERVGPLSRRGARHRRRPARAGAGVAPVASRQRACRRRCFSGAWPTRMSEESQRAWSRFQTPRARYAAMGDWEGKLKRFESILRLGLNSSKVRCRSTRQFSVARREDRSITSRTEKPPYEARVRTKILRQILQLLRQLRSAFLIDCDKRAFV